MAERRRNDAFESRYMSGDDNVRHRDKRVSRGMAAILGFAGLFVVALTVAIGVANATAARPLPAVALPFVLAAMAGLAGMFGLLAITFAVLRTVVTDREVIIKYGLWGPSIPLDAITSCKVVRYEWTRFGGWGIRRGRGGVWAYVPGPGDVVEIAYTEKGKEKRILVGVATADLVAAEIQHARQALRAGLRIDPTDDEELGAIEAEREAMAAEEAEAKEAEQRR